MRWYAGHWLRGVELLVRGNEEEARAAEEDHGEGRLRRVEAIGSAGQQSDLVVEALDQAVREPPPRVGHDLVEVVANRSCGSRERWQPCAQRPGDPAEQEGAHDRGL